MSVDGKQTSADEVIQAQQQARFNRLKHQVLVVTALVLLAVVAFVIYLGLSADGVDVGSGIGSADDSANKSAIVKPAQSTAEQEQAREKFKSLLADYEANIAPQLSQISQGQWGQSELDSFATDMERSLTLFAKAEFVQATSLLEALQTSAQTHITNWQLAYEEKLSEAKDYYRNKQVQQARLALTQADNIIPNDDRSEVLRAQLFAYDRVEVYVSQLNVAKVENDLEKQIALMQQVLKADPTRSEIREPLDKAINELKQNRLSFALQAAQRAFDVGNTSEAQSYIQQAEKINASAKGIPALKEELNRRVSNQSLQSIKSELNTLQATDNWQLVYALAQRGLSRFSSDADLLASQNRATQVLSSKRRLDQFIARSDRLSDDNIRAAAQDAIAESITMLPLSPSLASRAHTLASYIDQYASKVAITVLSDGKTDISVIATGTVGKSKQKVIELSPGSYVLEGKRAGYRSKRLEISVAIGQPFSVEVICDEKI